MTETLNADWKDFFKDMFKYYSFNQLNLYLNQEPDFYPPKENVFRAFNLCSLENTKVVILGQDPYHGKDEADGLAFSVAEHIKQPPSLRNIFKELENDLGYPPPASGSLEHWAKQGVLLMNAILTVRPNQAGSHRKKGWEEFTNSVIEKLSEEKEHLVFILWGSYAKEKKQFIDTEKHLILEATHPSPLSANRGGFFGSAPFSKTNAYLKTHHLTEIDWKL